MSKESLTDQIVQIIKERNNQRFSSHADELMAREMIQLALRKRKKVKK